MDNVGRGSPEAEAVARVPVQFREVPARLAAPDQHPAVNRREGRKAPPGAGKTPTTAAVLPSTNTRGVKSALGARSCEERLAVDERDTAGGSAAHAPGA